MLYWNLSQIARVEISSFIINDLNGYRHSAPRNLDESAATPEFRGVSTDLGKPTKAESSIRQKRMLLFLLFSRTAN